MLNHSSLEMLYCTLTPPLKSVLERHLQNEYHFIERPQCPLILHLYAMNVEALILPYLCQNCIAGR